jgi:hypothetical protein
MHLKANTKKLAAIKAAERKEQQEAAHAEEVANLRHLATYGDGLIQTPGHFPAEVGESARKRMALGAQSQVTSTGTADVKTVGVPSSASAFLVSVETNGCRVTLDGSTPGATSLLIATTATFGPVTIPCVSWQGNTLKVASNAAANSIVTIQWLS